MDDDRRTQCETGHGSLAVKLSSTRNTKYFYVNWWLTDHCNWDCSYCHDILKRGDIPFPDIKDIKNFIDQTADFCRKNHKIMQLDLTGGEVTEYPFLEELLEHAKCYDACVKLRTNASKSVESFSRLLGYLSTIEIEFHPEHTQTSHFLLCLNQASLIKDLAVAVNLNALPQRFDEVDALQTKIKEKWPQFEVKLKMLFDDPVRNTKPMFYEEPQKVKLKRQTGSLVLSYENDQEYTDYQTLILENKNQFESWQCKIGIEQIIVDAYGIVRKGHCRQGGSIGRIGSTIRFEDTDVICKKSHCVNGFDILATKIKSS